MRPALPRVDLAARVDSSAARSGVVGRFVSDYPRRIRGSSGLCFRNSRNRRPTCLVAAPGAGRETGLGSRRRARMRCAGSPGTTQRPCKTLIAGRDARPLAIYINCKHKLVRGLIEDQVE